MLLLLIYFFLLSIWFYLLFVLFSLALCLSYSLQLSIIHPIARAVLRHTLPYLSTAAVILASENLLINIFRSRDKTKSIT